MKKAERLVLEELIKGESKQKLHKRVGFEMDVAHWPIRKFQRQQSVNDQTFKVHFQIRVKITKKVFVTISCFFSEHANESSFDFGFNSCMPGGFDIIFITNGKSICSICHLNVAYFKDMAHKSFLLLSS